MCSLVDRGILAQILTPVHSYKLIQAYREPQEGEELGVELEDEGEGLEEEGLEEEEEEEKPRSFFWPLVSELPLEMQAYRYIESFGAEGIYAAVSLFTSGVYFLYTLAIFTSIGCNLVPRN